MVFNRVATKYHMPDLTTQPNLMDETLGVLFAQGESPCRRLFVRPV